MGKISLRIRYDSYIGIFRPFGTISEIFEKSSAERSAEDSVIPCFPESEKKPLNDCSWINWHSWGEEMFKTITNCENCFDTRNSWPNRVGVHGGFPALLFVAWTIHNSDCLDSSLSAQLRIKFEMISLGNEIRIWAALTTSAPDKGSIKWERLPASDWPQAHTKCEIRSEYNSMMIMWGKVVKRQLEMI